MLVQSTYMYLNVTMQVGEGNTCSGEENEIQQTVTEITSTIDRLWKWRKNGTQI